MHLPRFSISDRMDVSKTMFRSANTRVALLVCCAFSLHTASLWAAEAKRVFVEPFTTKAQSEKLRQNVVSELRKDHAISLVTSETNADLILGGGGEIWVKGYQSLNPRSGRLSSNRTPVYRGYLSVELRCKNGETVWSYLASAGSETDDLVKELSRRIAKQVEEAVDHNDVVPQRAAGSHTKTTLKGAGATFPFPVYSKWFTNFKVENPDVEITYEPIDSDAGIRKLLAGEVDFGATENPDAIRDAAPGGQHTYLLFPTVVGAVVPIVNLPGLAGQVALTPEALAGIYLGRIRKWNDPILRAANRGLRLPDLDIVVVHREDGSGTSYAWTDFLSKTNPAWKTEIGSSPTPKWPVGKTATGNDGVAKLVKELGGSIGYVEFIYALQNHLSYGKVRNRNGEFVEASLESMAVAARQSAGIGDDLKISLVNAPGTGAYPITSFTWLVVRAHTEDEAKRTAITGFLKWMLGPGQTQAAALGYLGLPKDLIHREAVAIDRLR
jgi:phosphate ABC transporter phosphate-binding protein